MILFYAANYNQLKGNEYFKMFVGDAIYPNEQIPYYIKRIMRQCTVDKMLIVYHTYIDICNSLMDLPPSIPITYKIPDMKVLVPYLFRYKHSLNPNHSYHYRELCNIMFFVLNYHELNGESKIFIQDLDHLIQDVDYARETIYEHIFQIMKSCSYHEFSSVFDPCYRAYFRLIFKLR
jgi:hypothetical protein